MIKTLTIEEFIKNENILNRVYLSGNIGKLCEDSMHYLNGEYYYTTSIFTEGLSIPITISSKLTPLITSDSSSLAGKISNRYYNYRDSGGKRRRAFKSSVFVEDIGLSGEIKSDTVINSTYIRGNIYKKQRMRTRDGLVTLGATIAIDNINNKRELTAVYFYNKEAVYVDSLEVGDPVVITGKLLPHFSNPDKLVIRNRKLIMPQI